MTEVHMEFECEMYINECFYESVDDE